MSAANAAFKIDNRAQPKPAFPWQFFALTFGWSWAVWFACIAMMRSMPGTRVLFLLAKLAGSFGPTLAGFFLAHRLEGGTGVRRLLRRGLPSKISFNSLVLIVFIPLGVNGAAYWLAGGRSPNFSPVAILGTFILYFFLGGSVGEEFGWRGFALDRLQGRWHWITASLILGLNWSAWHFPLTLMPDTTQSATPAWVFFLSTTALAVIMTRIYNATGGNLFAMLLLHTFINITVVMFPPTVSAGVNRAAYYEAWIMAAVAMLMITVRARQPRHV